MNTTPDSPSKEFEESIEEKVSPQSPERARIDEETTNFKKGDNQVVDEEIEKDRGDQVDHRFLEGIAIKGRGWKRLKYMFTLVGIAISIITRYFLVYSF
jgi:hypothetical protein